MKNNYDLLQKWFDYAVLTSEAVNSKERILFCKVVNETVAEMREFHRDVNDQTMIRALLLLSDNIRYAFRHIDDKLNPIIYDWFGQANVIQKTFLNNDIERRESISKELMEELASAIRKGLFLKEIETIKALAIAIGEVEKILADAVEKKNGESTDNE